MAAPSRAPRTRASGGRTLMLLGVLLALAAGTIVIYIVSQATTTGGQIVTVIMAKQDIPAGTTLTVGPTNQANKFLSIADAFEAKQMSADDAPANFQPYTTPDALDVQLNNQVVIGTYYAGDILRQTDFTTRLASVATGGAPGSYTAFNPAQLPTNDVLVAVALTGAGGSTNGKPFAQPGDHVDFVVVDCEVPDSQGQNHCVAQTTLQDIYVYDVTGNDIIVAVTHDQAVQLVYIQHSLSLEIVLRKPGDNNSSISTAAVSNASIISQYNFGH